MPDPLIKVDVARWVELAKADPVNYLQRQATEITLNSIAMVSPLKDQLFLKGGVLMGLVYNSPRQTSDIDLSASIPMSSDVDEDIKSLLDKTFQKAAIKLGYPDLILKVHSIKKQPKKIFESASYPALKLKITFAKRGTRQEEILKEGRAANILDVDISFKEPFQNIQILELTGGQELRAYGLSDLLAEKYRAMLQQVVRNRSRRQDVYDIFLLIEREELDSTIQNTIYQSLLITCRSRNIEPTQTSLDDPELKRRSYSDWDTMELEISDLPQFESCFQTVRAFYKNLPWAIV